MTFARTRRMEAVARSAIIAGVLAISSPAYSQGDPAEPASVPRHAGVYVEGSAGAAYWSSDFRANETAVPDHTIKGWGAAYGLRAGWTWTGFTLGFGIEARTIWAVKRYERYGQVWASDDIRGVNTLGPFIDWYVYPQGGFHLGVMPGTGGCSGCEATLNISAWVGYDFRIRENWWVGVEPRYLAGGGFFGGASSKEILLAVTYN